MPTAVYTVPGIYTFSLAGKQVTVIRVWGSGGGGDTGGGGGGGSFIAGVPTDSPSSLTVSIRGPGSAGVPGASTTVVWGASNLTARPGSVGSPTGNSAGGTSNDTGNVTLLANYNGGAGNQSGGFSKGGGGGAGSAGNGNDAQGGNGGAGGTPDGGHGGNAGSLGSTPGGGGGGGGVPANGGGDRVEIDYVDATPAPSLTIADNADGTGGVATVGTAGSLGELAEVFAGQVTGQLGAITWAAGGVGNLNSGGGATITLVKPPGYYWWRLSIDGTPTSAFVYQNLTNGLTAVHSRILDAYVATLQALTLQDLAEVRRCGVPMNERLSLPCCLVTAFQKPETMLNGTLQRDDLGYPVYVVFVTQDVQQDELEPRMMLWRQKASRAFRGQRLAGVPEVLTTTVEPDPVIDWNPRLENYQFSGMTFRVHTREVRGFGA